MASGSTRCALPAIKSKAIYYYYYFFAITKKLLKIRKKIKKKIKKHKKNNTRRQGVKKKFLRLTSLCSLEPWVKKTLRPL